MTILTGFLGAGKTTLVRRLLAERDGARVGVVMNELGQAGIDRVAPAEAPWDGGFVELAGGCVCCVDNPGLATALEAMRARGDLARVILETTGLADPLPLVWMLQRDELAGVARLDGVVVVVDAANHDATHVDEWRAQVACADLVILSKLDLVDEAGAARARAAVREVNPRAALLDGAADLPIELVFDVAAEPQVRPTPTGVSPRARHSDYGSFAVADRTAYDADAIEDLAESLPAAVFRAKGIVRLVDGRWAELHTVGGRAAIDFDAAPPAHGESRLLFFGRALDRDELTRRLAACRR